MQERYFLETSWQDKKEVTKEQFIQAERNAGFHCKPGITGCATGGFSGGGVHGTVEYVKDKEDDKYPVSAENFLATVAANVKNAGLDDTEFRKFIEKSLLIVKYDRSREEHE
jgi:hypothetical protein